MMESNGKYPQLKTEPIEVRGHRYLITELTGDALDLLDMDVEQERIRDERGLAAAIVCRCLLNEQGQRLFSDKDDQDVNAKWPGIELRRVAAAVIKLSRLDNENKELAKKK